MIVELPTDKEGFHRQKNAKPFTIDSTYAAEEKVLQNDCFVLIVVKAIIIVSLHHSINTIRGSTVFHRSD